MAEKVENVEEFPDKNIRFYQNEIEDVDNKNHMAKYGEIDNYSLKYLLGNGLTSKVFAATDQKDGARVAIKVLDHSNPDALNFLGRL